MIRKKLIFGTAQFIKNYSLFKKGLTSSEKKSLIIFAQKKNFKYFETSPIYGDAEIVLGKYLKKSNVIWKLPKLPKQEKYFSKWVKSQTETSLKNLKKKSFNTILLHNSRDLLNKNGQLLYRELLNLKKKRKCLKIGISVYKKKILFKILKKFKIDVVQLPINLIDLEFKNQDLISIKKIQKKIEIQARSIFHQGLLLKKLKKNKNRNFLNLVKEQNLIIDQLKKICEEKKVNLLKLCFTYVYNNKLIDSIVLGFENLKEVDQITNLNRFKNIDFKKIKYNKSILNPISWLKLKH